MSDARSYNTGLVPGLIGVEYSQPGSGCVRVDGETFAKRQHFVTHMGLALALGVRVCRKTVDDLSDPFTRGAKFLGIEASGGDGGYPEP